MRVPLTIIGFVLLSTAGFAQQTPPMQPKVQETPLPPPIVLPAPAATSGVPDRPLTADEAAQIALCKQPNVTAAQASVTAARGREIQAKSALMPTLGTTSTYTNVTLAPVGTVAGSGTTSGFQINASLKQLVFDFDHTRDVVRQSTALLAASKAGLTKVQSDTVLQVKQAFYVYSQDVRLVAVNEANVKNAQSHLDLAQARLNSGLGLPADVVRAQTAVADAIFNLTTARNAASVARVTLAQLMGIDPRTPIDVADADETAIASDDLTALTNQALKCRAEVIQADANIKAADYAVGAARTTNSPALSANAGWLERGSDFPPGNDTVTYGLALQFTPFDSGYTAGKVEEAKANLLAAQAQLQQTQLTVTSDVSQAYLNLKTAEQRVVTADAEIANAEESQRLNEGRYKSGLGTFLDVLDAETALITANTNRVNAQSSVNQARASLAHAVGAPLPSPPAAPQATVKK